MMLFLVILFILGIFSLAFTEEVHGFGLGVIFTALLSIVFYSISTGNKPTALDVYRGNTELRIKSVNGVPTDTTVVFKKG